MNRILPTLRYLSKGFTAMTVIAFMSILGSAAITHLVFYLTDRNNTDHRTLALTAPLDVTAALFALMTGLLLFMLNFKVVVANGVSRKTFLLANLPAAVLAAAALSIFNLLVVLASELFWPIILTSNLFYPQIGYVGILLLQFALNFLLIAAGWLIAMAFYRTSGWGQRGLLLAPFVLFGLYKVANARLDGALYQAIRDFLRWSLGTPSSATLSMLAYALVLCGLVYWLVRRAPLKE